MKTITASHHKSSIHYVQNELYTGHGRLRSKCSKLNSWNAFCWKKNQDMENGSQGKATLQSLVHDHKAKYLTLSNEEQDEILAQFAEWKQTKTTSVHTSTKSKINDITQTLKAVENEARVRDFMGSVIGIDSQEFISKMEGFAVQGMKGAAKNHQQRVSEICSAICDIINHQLQEITSDSHTKMQWVHYFRNVIQHYQECEEKIESEDLVDHRRRTRSDKGKKQKNTEGTTATHHKCVETIRDSDTDTDVE
ncbi:hypothetical protein M405DRAFT_844925 [Rhizopogon salebrosus TDB-379]|nr:hypothetical protein M405DRAFT_844925 [Rhizopogon salebrosus TDB-379]